MTDIKLSAELLQQIIDGCEGVQPGPYRADEHGNVYYAITPIPPDCVEPGERDWEGLILIHDEGTVSPREAAHFARLDPATVKAMAELALSALAARTQSPAEWQEFTERHRTHFPHPDGTEIEVHGYDTEYSQAFQTVMRVGSPQWKGHARFIAGWRLPAPERSKEETGVRGFQERVADEIAAQRRRNEAMSNNLRALAEGEEWWAGVKIQPMASAPSGADAPEPYEIETHDGAWAVILDTNAKPIGWFNAHSAFTATRHRATEQQPRLPLSEPAGWRVEAARKAFVAAVRDQGDDWCQDEEEGEVLLVSPDGDYFALDLPIAAALRAASTHKIEAHLGNLAHSYPLGMHFRIEHDGFEGSVIGHYVRLDGKRGVVGQQAGTNIVHVYGEKWLS